ncbi:Putative invertase inhibitor [Linum grandiflorum]
MKPIYILLLIQISLTFLLTTFPTPNEALGFDKNDLIEKVCSKTLNKEDCLASLASTKGSQLATLPELGVIALDNAVQNATKTSVYIKMMLSNQNLDPAVEQALQDCFQQYLDVVDQLDDSTAALLANATTDVQTWVSAAMSDVDSCDQGLKEHRGSELVLSRRNAGFRQLCSTVLAINSLYAQTL